MILIHIFEVLQSALKCFRQSPAESNPNSKDAEIHAVRGMAVFIKVTVQEELEDCSEKVAESVDVAVGTRKMFARRRKVCTFYIIFIYYS
jgi:hypothetical protein